VAWNEEGALTMGLFSPTLTLHLQALNRRLTGTMCQVSELDRERRAAQGLIRMSDVCGRHSPRSGKTLPIFGDQVGKEQGVAVMASPPNRNRVRCKRPCREHALRYDFAEPEPEPEPEPHFTPIVPIDPNTKPSCACSNTTRHPVASIHLSA
jgi:hypothetical protein